MPINPNNTASWLGVADPARREAFERAVNVSTAGGVLIQTYINRVVQMLTLREFGLQAVLDRTPGQGDKAYINRRAAGSTGGAWVADTDGVTEETGTYSQVSFAYRTLATRGRVTRKLQAIGRSYGDALAQEITAKAEDFADTLEAGCITGDSGANANQINGLLTLVNAVGTDVVSNITTASGGGALTLARLDEAIDKVKGSANRSDLVIVGSFAGLRGVNSALQAQQQFVNEVEIKGGFRVKSYDGIPLVVSTRMPDTIAAGATGGIITSFTSGTSTAIAVINKRYVKIEELTPTTVMPLAKTDSQFDQFDMFWDGALVLHNTRGAALLTGIRTT
jgi:HK97 family phage major capsid protein